MFWNKYKKVRIKIQQVSIYILLFAGVNRLLVLVYSNADANEKSYKATRVF